MIDLDEIRLWRARLECEESSWQNYEKLAILYCIQDHQQDPRREAEISPFSAPAPVVYQDAEPDFETVGEYGDSDFLHAISGKRPADAWEIMDELMDTMRVVNVRVYNSVMEKIEGLQS